MSFSTSIAIAEKKDCVHEHGVLERLRNYFRGFKSGFLSSRR
jgi:hypothetical protein